MFNTYSAIFILVKAYWEPYFVRTILLLPYSGKRLYRTPAYLGTFQSYFAIFTLLDILRHISSHLRMFWQMQTYSESCHRYTYSCILKYFQNPWLIQAYSKPLTVSDTTQEQFTHILNLNWTLTYLGT